MHHIEKWSDLYKSFDKDFESRSSHTSVKNVFLKILQNSKRLQNFLKEDTPAQMFPYEFAQFLRTNTVLRRTPVNGCFY